MTKERALRIRQIYGVVLSIVIIIAGICLMAQCVSIYRSGDQPFSREAVAAHFSPIAPFIYLCLAMTAGSFLLPKEGKKPAPQKQYALILEKLQEKKDLSQCGEPLRSAILAQRNSRARHKAIRNGLCVLCAAVFLCYGMNPGNFHQSEINDSMIRAMYVLIPCLLIPFGYALFTARHCRASLQEEIELMKQAPSAAAPTARPEKKERTGALRWAVAAAAIAALVFGFVSGGTADVLTKAINICTECVGLG